MHSKLQLEHMRRKGNAFQAAAGAHEKERQCIPTNFL